MPGSTLFPFHKTGEKTLGGWSSSEPAHYWDTIVARRIGGDGSDALLAFRVLCDITARLQQADDDSRLAVVQIDPTSHVAASRNLEREPPAVRNLEQIRWPRKKHASQIDARVVRHDAKHDCLAVWLSGRRRWAP